MLQKDLVKQVSSGVSLGGYSMSTLLNHNSMIKLANNSYHSLCISCAFNVTTAIFNHCFNFDSPEHGVVSCPHKKYQKNILYDNNNFIEIKQIQGGSGGGKTWAKCSDKKGQAN